MSGVGLIHELHIILSALTIVLLAGRLLVLWAKREASKDSFTVFLAVLFSFLVSVELVEHYFIQESSELFDLVVPVFYLAVGAAITLMLYFRLKKTGIL